MNQETADRLNKALQACADDLSEFMDYYTGSTELCVKDIIKDHFGPILKELTKDQK